MTTRRTPATVAGDPGAVVVAAVAVAVVAVVVAVTRGGARTARAAQTKGTRMIEDVKDNLAL